MAMQLKLHVSGIREQVRGGTSLGIVQMTVDPDPGNCTPAGCEDANLVRIALDEMTASTLKIGQAFTLTLA